MKQLNNEKSENDDFTYRFHMPDKKKIRYYFIISGLILILSCFGAISILGDDGIFIPIIIIFIFLVGVFISGVKFKIQEEVIIRPTGICSSSYGKIDFADIKWVRSIRSTNAGAASVNIKLKSGKKYKWVTALDWSTESNRNFYGLFHQLPKSFDAYNKNKS